MFLEESKVYHCIIMNAAIGKILILTGTKTEADASTFFKKYFFSKKKLLAPLLEAEELNKIWIDDKKEVEFLNTIIEKKITDFKAKKLEQSAKLKIQEWEFIGKYSNTPDSFNQYKNRSSGIFGNTRVYLALKVPDEEAIREN